MKESWKVLLCVFISLAAGASLNHQYYMMNHGKLEPVRVQNVHIEAEPIEEKQTEPVEQLIVEMETPEELEEEMYYDSLELLAMCVEAEAGNQGLLGKRLVVDVVLNRVNDKDFPDNITDVITQPYHFSSYWDGRMEQIEPTEETFEAVRMELEEISYPGVLYFTAEGYSRYGTPWKKVGDHYFSTK